MRGLSGEKTNTFIPADSQVILACYQDEKLSYFESVVKLENEDTYYFIPNQAYDSAKVMVFDGFCNLVPLCEPVLVE